MPRKAKNLAQTLRWAAVSQHHAAEALRELSAQSDAAADMVVEAAASSALVIEAATRKTERRIDAARDLHGECQRILEIDNLAEMVRERDRLVAAKKG